MRVVLLEYRTDFMHESFPYIALNKQNMVDAKLSDSLVN